MTSINVIMWILFVVGLTVMDSAAASRALTAPSPIMASVDDVTNTVTSQDIIFEWLKVTAVPLGVFLIGACTWGCIKNTVVWRSFTGLGRDFETREADEVRPSEPPIHSSTGNASDNFGLDTDLEEGLELSHRRMDDGLAMSAQILKIQHPPLEIPNGEEKSVATHVDPQL